MNKLFFLFIISCLFVSIQLLNIEFPNVEAESHTINATTTNTIAYQSIRELGDSLVNITEPFRLADKELLSQTVYKLNNGQYKIEQTVVLSKPLRLINDTGFYNNPYFLTETASIVQLESGQGSFVWDKNTCALTIFENNFITIDSTKPFESDSYYVKRFNGTQIFDDVDVNSATCSTAIVEVGNNIKITGTKITSNGELKINIIKDADKLIKPEIEFKNTNPAWAGNQFIITETIQAPSFNFAEIEKYKLLSNSLEIEFTDGTTIEIEENQSYEFTKVDIDNNVIIFPDFLGFVYDYGDGLQFHNATKLSLTGATIPQLSIDFISPILNNGETFTLDPIYGFTPYNSYNNVQSVSSETTSCGAGDVKDAQILRVDMPRSTLDTRCKNLIFNFNIDPIPDSATIDNTQLKITTDSTGGESNPVSCDYASIDGINGTLGSAATAQELYTDVLDGNYITANTGCATDDVAFTMDLGTTADTDLKSQLGIDIFSVGMSDNNQVRSGTKRVVVLTADSAELEVTYSYVTPPSVLNLSYIFDETQYNFTFTPNGEDTDEVIGYDIEKNSIARPFSITTKALLHVKGDNTLTNYGSSAAKLTINGGVEAYQASPLGYGIFFDGGTDTNYDLDNESDFDFERTDSFSVSYRLSILDAFGSPFVVSKYHGDATGGGDPLGWASFFSDCSPAFTLRNDNSPSQRITVRDGTLNPCDGKWRTFTWTYDGTSLASGVTYYVNGIDKTSSLTIDSDDLGTNSILNNHNLVICSDDKNAQDCNDGTVIDDIRIYDFELTLAQALDIHNESYETKWTYPTDASLTDNTIIGKWFFDNSLHDSSLNGIDWIPYQANELFVDGTFGRAIFFPTSPDNNDEPRFNATTRTMSDITTNDFAVAWHMKKGDSGDNINPETLIAKGDLGKSGIDGQRWTVYVDAGGNEQPAFSIKDSSGSTEPSCTLANCPEANDDAYHTWIWNLDRDANAHLWIDGKEKTLTSADISSRSGTLTNTIFLQLGNSWQTGNGINRPLSNTAIDWLIIYDGLLSDTEIWNLGNFTGFVNKTSVIFTDSNISTPFSANYTAFSINPIGQSVLNNQIFTAPSPDNSTTTQITTSSNATGIVITVNPEPATYGTTHGYYIDRLNTTENFYRPEPFDMLPPNFYWKFDGKETGTTNYGTTTIANLDVIGNENYGNGTVGSGLSYDGNTYYKVISSEETNFDFEHTDTFSVSFWAKPTATNTDGDVYVSKQLQFSPNTAGWRVNDKNAATDFVAFLIVDSEGNTFGTNSSPNSVPDDVWTYIVTTFSGNSNRDGMKVYINGILNATGTSSAISNSILNDEDFRIGAMGDASKIADGGFDELRIWDIELSQANVTSLFEYLSPAIDSNPYEQELLHLKFNSNLFDSAHGFEKTIKENGTPNFVTGKIGNGMNLVQADLEFLDLDESYDNIISGTNKKFTWSLWYQKDDGASADNIISKHASSACTPSENQRQFYISTGTDESVTVGLYVDGGSANFELWDTPVSALTIGQLDHIIVTVDLTQPANDNTRIYINNVNQTVTRTLGGTFTDTIFDGTAHLAIGNAISSTGLKCGSVEADGIFDDIRLIPKIISSSERAEIYNSGAGTENPLGVTPLTPLEFLDPVTGSVTKTYKIFAIGGAGQSSNSTTFTQQSVDVDPPTSLTAIDISNTQIDLSWIAPASGDPPAGYKIERESPIGGGWSTIVANTTTTTTIYSNTGLTTKTQYNYRVSTHSATETSSPSNEAAAFTRGVPDAVTSFSITLATVNTLKLDWTAATPYGSPVTGHKLERESPIGDGFSTLSNDIGNVTTYTDTGLTVVTEYNYRLTPLSALGNGDTNTASGKTVTTPPTNLLVLPNGTDTNVLLLSWVAPVPSTGVNGYQIEREAPVGDGFSIIVANTTTTTVAYNDTGLVIDTFYNYRVAALTQDGVSQVSNTYSQTTFHLPDSVDDLAASPSTLVDIVLTWTTPNKLYGYVLGYLINSTTPQGDPLTVLINHTESTATIFTATNLDPSVVYSFRVSAVTIHGTNSTFGNIANATATSEFVVGEINLPTDPNPNTIPISFVLFTVDSDTKDLQVTYDSAMDLRCNFDYKFARTNTNYTGLVENPLTGSKVFTNFTINNPDNEIIDINCIDQLDGNNTGKYRISQSSIVMPFITQATDFQSGAFGTSGQFGAIDLITLLVVIISMIGFNRVNPAVGVFLMIAMIGALSFYGIIGSWTVVLSGLALIAMLAIITVKKT